MRKVIFSTTVILYHKDEYLMLHRTGNVSVDKNRLNGIGGKLEPGENFLDAAIRETREETGYVVSPKTITFSGIIKLSGGYAQDWLMCFFKIEVPSKEIPCNTNFREGKLIWMHKDKILTSGYELVDDLRYIWESIVSNKLFFAASKAGKDEKVQEISMSYL